MIGKTLGHYRIVERLGATGVGEVYRAEDTNLSWQVAIRVSPEFFAKDPERHQKQLVSSFRRLKGGSCICMTTLAINSLRIINFNLAGTSSES